MPRKMIFRSGSSSYLLEEGRAANEEELRSLVKDNPDLLPVEEFGLPGPLMVVGRETNLRSGAVDLICVTPEGDLLVIEFKTGPQNSDFRHALAQLLHYGSDLWEMSYEGFELTVVSRYFNSPSCRDSRVAGKTSLEEGLRATWPEMTQENLAFFKDRLIRQLEQGAFNYVLVASNFTETVNKTISYLNDQGSISKFFAVELIPFFGEDDMTAYESRTVVKPIQRARQSVASSMDESRLLEQVGDDRYRESFRHLFEFCRGLNLGTSWGSAGTSIRMNIPDSKAPLSIGWVFPPGTSGWMGLKDVTLGIELQSASRQASVGGCVDKYLESLGKLPGVELVDVRGLRAVHIDEQALIQLSDDIADIIAELVSSVNG